MRVGVLALQGAFAAHVAALRALGHTAIEVRRAEDLRGIEGLVLPGGESTAQARLMDRALTDGIGELVHAGAPVLATCAGVILAARAGWLDVEVTRNAYGPQLHSSEALADDLTPMVLIRAPRIDKVGPRVEVLARHEGDPVLVREGAFVAATFHPELTSDLHTHRRTFGSGLDLSERALELGP